MKLRIDRNAAINISFIFLSIYLGIVLSPFCFFIWFGFQLLDDLTYYGFGWSILNPEIRIQRGYQFGNVFLSSLSEDGRDLGFNFYDGDLSKNRHQAQIDKWEFMLKELNLSPGDSLIDIGCGYGDWLNYARSKGIYVVGVNITSEQAAAAKKKHGIEVICTNWKSIAENSKLREQLYGQFDAVTFMDTIEHYVPAKDRSDRNAQNKIYADMFELAAKLMKPDSRSHRIFISCLHQTVKQVKVKEQLLSYLLDKYHSGCYPTGDEGITQNATPFFAELRRYDKTEDYRLTSVIDRKHFGAAQIKWSFKKALSIPVLLLLDPHHIHKWIDIYCDAWIHWHFGNSGWQANYRSEHHLKDNRVQLWWIVLERTMPKQPEELKTS